MKEFINALGILVSLAWASQAHAQVRVDVAQIACKQYVVLETARINTLSTWLSGYFNAARNNTVVDIAAMRENREALKKYCLMNPGASLLDAAKNVLGATK